MTAENSDAVTSSGLPTTSGLPTPEDAGTPKEKGKCGCKGFTRVQQQQQVKKKRKKNYSITTWFKERAGWTKNIKKHRKDLRRAKPMVDDKAPTFNVLGVYDPEIFNSIRISLNAAFNMNVAMVRSLHDVNIVGGRTETFNYRPKPRYSNYFVRKDIAQQIEKRNAIMSHLIQNPKVRVMTVKDYAKEWEKHEAFIESMAQFPLYWKVKTAQKAALQNELPPPRFQQYITEKSAKHPDRRPRVFLEVSIKNVGVVGRMVVMLYSDYVPMTVKNFLTFCDPKAELTYKGNRFYFIFQNFYCQTGDVVENQGFGGTSIYGPYFGSEDFTLKHGERGVLTMYTQIPNRNQSQFWILFRKLQSLDGNNVVFGKVVRGFHVLDAIESVGSKKTGHPREEIFISDCDEI